MPILRNAKTVYVDDNPWQSPDGKVKIWTIKLEVNGERQNQSTMSEKIATEGWSGDVEIYTNAKGKDYVRQAPKEDGGFSGGNAQPAKYAPKDDHTQESIARSVALKAAVDAAAISAVNEIATSEQGILKTAEVFLAWLQGSSETQTSQDPKIKTQDLQSAVSGYDKFKQQGKQLQHDERDEFNDMRQSYEEPMPDYPGDVE